MASFKDKSDEEKIDSQSEDNESKKNFQSLQKGEEAKSNEIIADSTTKSIVFLGIGEFQWRKQASSIASEDHVSRMIRLSKSRFNDKSECSLEGNWSLFCSREISDSGISQADEILRNIQELYETRKDLFSRAPHSFKLEGDKLVVCCYTKNYEDKTHVLKVVKAIRDIVDYPYIMYYRFKRMDRVSEYYPYMHTPNNEFYISVNGNWILENPVE